MIDNSQTNSAHCCERSKSLGRYKWRNEMEFDETKKCTRVKFNIGPIRIDLNPVVTVASAIIIWGFVIWCIIQPKPANQELSTWMLWVTKTWTWLYIGTQDGWAVFIIVVYFSKYSNIKLGKPDDKPEYGDATYFTMLFAAGIGIGLFYFGVAEPIWHYEPGRHGNRYWGRYVSTLISVLVLRESAEQECLLKVISLTNILCT